MLAVGSGRLAPARSLPRAADLNADGLDESSAVIAVQGSPSDNHSSPIVAMHTAMADGGGCHEPRTVSSSRAS